MPITASGTSTRLLVMKSSKRPSSVGVSVRVAILKISAPWHLASRAFTAKIRAFGVDLKLWNEMIRRMFFFSANVSRDRSARAERNSTSM
jgi:hypothetical protein